MQYKSSHIYYLEVMTNVNFKKNRTSNVKVKKLRTNKKILSLGIFMRNLRALAFTVQKLSVMLKISKKLVKLQGQGHRVKNHGTHGKVLSQGIFM